MRILQRSTLVCLLCFCVPFFCFSQCRHHFTVAFPFLHSSWEHSLSLLGLPPLLIFLKTCLKLTMVRLSVEATSPQVKLCPYDEEESAISGSNHRGTVCRNGNQVAKVQVHQCFGQSAQESFGTF